MSRVVVITFIIFSCLCIHQIRLSSSQIDGDDYQSSQLHAPTPTASSSSSYIFTNTNPGHHDDTNYEIVTTNYGWKSSNPTAHSQRKVSQEFFNAILSHPKYNASASWDELEQQSHPDPNRRLIIFLDIDTCMENNYPIYGKTFEVNMAINVTGEKWHGILSNACEYIWRVSNSPALTANKHNRFILLDCGNGPWYRLFDVCGIKATKALPYQLKFNNTQTIIANYGIRKDEARSWDIGLPAPAVKNIELAAHERLWVQTCTKRPYIFSFQGRGGWLRRYGHHHWAHLREKLKELEHHGRNEDVYVKIRDENTYWGKSGDIYDYDAVMRSSVFAGAPKGDCLFSYRFAEIMAAGAVPVVYADEWVRPFSSVSDPNRVINWSKCAIFVPEVKATTTINILRNISDEVRCEMQKCALAFWDEFASSREGWLKGILRWVNNDPEIRASG